MQFTVLDKPQIVVVGGQNSNAALIAVPALPEEGVQYALGVIVREYQEHFTALFSRQSSSAEWDRADEAIEKQILNEVSQNPNTALTRISAKAVDILHAALGYGDRYWSETGGLFLSILTLLPWLLFEVLPLNYSLMGVIILDFVLALGFLGLHVLLKRGMIPLKPADIAGLQQGVLYPVGIAVAQVVIALAMAAALYS